MFVLRGINWLDENTRLGQMDTEGWRFLKVPLSAPLVIPAGFVIGIVLAIADLFPERSAR